jgi:hypothetical protein
MAEYQKIQTLFKRDEKNIIIPSMFTLPEFEYLKDCKWEATEKIDGTNMRVELGLDNNDYEMHFKGRTDKAEIPKHLLEKMHNLFDEDKLIDYFYPEDKNEIPNITLYGEGYGMKIQKGGNYIKNDVDFILFDVRVGNWWLSREACEKIASDFNLKIVPIIGYMTLQEAIDFVKKGFKSTIAENKDYDAEGLVLKTPYGLKLRNNERLITKIKTCDFQKYQRVYGDEPVEQKINSKYNENNN